MRKLIMFVCGVVLVLAMVIAGCNTAAKTTTTTSATTTSKTTATTSATTATTKPVGTTTTTKPVSTTTTTTGTTAPPTVTKVVEQSIRALSPRGIALPVETKPLSARLDTIKGKNIYIAQGEADPVIMPALYDYAKAKYPDTNWIYYQPTSGFGPTTPTTETLNGSDEVKKADAIIRGIGW